MGAATAEPVYIVCFPDQGHVCPSLTTVHLSNLNKAHITVMFWHRTVTESLLVPFSEWRYVFRQ
jgi:hypothetical protein